jgi:methionyl-tRNA synthetase
MQLKKCGVFDALSNYISALGYGEDGEDFDSFWTNGDIAHIIEKILPDSTQYIGQQCYFQPS